MSRTSILLYRAALLLLLVSGAGCDSPSASRAPLAGLQILGNGQGGTVGAELLKPIQVTALDANGEPVKGVLVQFVVTSGGGTLSVPQGQTNADGIVENHWTLGVVASDSQRVEVRASDPATGAARAYAVLRAVAAPGAPAAVQVLPSQPGWADALHFGPSLDETFVAPAARLVDAYGNPVPDAAVTWIQRTGGGDFPVRQTMTGPDGVARTTWRLAPQEEPQEMIAAIVGVSVPIMGLAVGRACADLELHGSVPALSAPGSVHSLTFRLVAKPIYGTGRPIAGARVTFQATGVSIDRTEVVTDAEGYVQVNWHIPEVAGGVAPVLTVEIYRHRYYTFTTRVQTGAP